MNYPGIYLVSTANSTTANLAGGAVFTGTSEDVSQYSPVSISVFASHASATDGLSLQQSSDGTNWDITDTYTIPATTGKVFALAANAKFFRLVYTNGGTLTTSLRIQTIYHYSAKKGSSQRPQDARSNDNDMEEMISYLSVFNGTTWDRVRGTGGALNVTKASPLFRGRAQTFRTPGRAGTTGQKIMSIHNATGSTINLQINKITVDLVGTTAKAVTVLPPVIRMWKVTVLPTNGTTLAKTKIGGTTTSSASVTILGDASADGTGSGTTLTATLPAGTFISQEFAPRLITAAGYEVADRLDFLGDSEVTLGALEGVVVFLDYVLATQNPTTDMWIAGVEWEEKTP